MLNCDDPISGKLRLMAYSILIDRVKLQQLIAIPDGHIEKRVREKLDIADLELLLLILNFPP